MGLRSFIKTAYEVGFGVDLDHEREVYKRLANQSDEPRQLTEADFDDFIAAAQERDDPLWVEIDSYLRGPLRQRWPVRANKLQKEIRWLRKQAAKDGLIWGSQ